MKCIGIMSGTSVDGIDVCLCDIEGVDSDTEISLLDFDTYPFTPEMREDILRAMDVRQATLPLISSLNFALSYAYADAVKDMIARNNLQTKDIEFVATHGQTIYHDPEALTGTVPSTLQIGDGTVLSQLLGITVVWNFRPADMAAGGQGAPLVPYVDKIMYSSSVNRGLLNIGGISNITVLSASEDQSSEDVLAFDLGPGNMMVDAACDRLFGISYDADGHIGRSGAVDDGLLLKLMQMDYFDVKPPKSTGRELFGVQLTNKILNEYSLSPEDFVATFTEFTAKSIADGLGKFVNPYVGSHLDELIVSGGGAYNSFLVERIQANLPDTKVMIQEDLGFSSDAKEAVAFCILGNQTIHHLPSNLPEATGATRPAVLGTIAYC